MRQKRNSEQSPSERVVRNIQRKTRLGELLAPGTWSAPKKSGDWP